MGYLTRRQLEVVEFIRQFTAENGFSPTLEEIAGRFGVTKATAQQYVITLRYKGVLTRRPYQHRALELVEEALPDAARASLPLVGRIASLDDVRHAAKEQDMRTLQEDGLMKIAAGLTTVEEVMRVTTA
jgi:SOS-response transcriptional repressor LexA